MPVPSTVLEQLSEHVRQNGLDADGDGWGCESYGYDGSDDEPSPEEFSDDGDGYYGDEYYDEDPYGSP